MRQASGLQSTAWPMVSQGRLTVAHQGTACQPPRPSPAHYPLSCRRSTVGVTSRCGHHGSSLSVAMTLQGSPAAEKPHPHFDPPSGHCFPRHHRYSRILKHTWHREANVPCAYGCSARVRASWRVCGTELQAERLRERAERAV